MKNNKDSLGDRMKGYEKVPSSTLYSKIPVIIRLNGKAFHSLTRKFKKPFDGNFIDAMVNAAEMVAKEMQGFRAGYIQSDEASFLLTDYDSIESQPWFGNKLFKIVSVSASLMTAYFNKYLNEFDKESIASFDSRAFNLPKEEVTNLFLWRKQDWDRNSLQMYARSFFSHKELHKKNKGDIHEMLYSIGKNWATDCSDVEKNGTFLIKDDRDIVRKTNILSDYESISKLLNNFL